MNNSLIFDSQLYSQGTKHPSSCHRQNMRTYRSHLLFRPFHPFQKSHCFRSFASCIIHADTEPNPQT